MCRMPAVDISIDGVRRLSPGTAKNWHELRLAVLRRNPRHLVALTKSQTVVVARSLD
jgi:hypothetical protein